MPHHDDLKRLQRFIDKALRRTIPRGTPPELARAMRYSLLAPGKRLRPILVLTSAEACGGSIRTALPAACAIEMIHAYSLVHDDLPAMDDDDFRRGRPTNHRVFGEASAILAGDALQSAAFELLARESSDVRLVAELASAAGPAGMAGGQMLDLKKSGSKQRQHALKTAALFRASTRLGALSAKADTKTVQRLGDYGFHLGLAFQTVDDILDADVDSGSAERHAKRLTQRALESIVFLGRKGARLREIAEIQLLRRR